MLNKLIFPVQPNKVSTQMLGKQTPHSAGKGEHIGLTQDCKQENYLRLGKYNTSSAGSGTNIPNDYKAKEVLT